MKNIRWYILIIVIIFVLSGCKSYKNQGVKFEKKDKAPKVLGDISSGIQDILKEKLLDKWEEINKKLEEIHSKWNSYEIEGMKKGVTSDISNRFKDSLNALTSSIEGKNIIGIYDYSSQTMLNLSPIFGLYKDEIWGEINKLKYLTYQSYLNTLKGDDLKTIELLKGSEEDISKIRLKLEKNDSKIKMLDKVNLSIEDMNKSLKENSIKLIRIKKDIIIKNLEELGK